MIFTLSKVLFQIQIRVQIKIKNIPIDLADQLMNLGRSDQTEQIFHRLLSQYLLGKSQLYDRLA